MWAIHQLKSMINSLPNAWDIKYNIEPILANMENLINDLRESNYNNQSRANIPCKYWRAGCCAFGNRCHYKHFKINRFPLACPYGSKCKRRINGKCGCVRNIRIKIGFRQAYSQPSGRISNRNNNFSSSMNKDSINNKQDNFNRKMFTVENNGMNNIATTKIAVKNIPQFKGNSKERLKSSQNINRLFSDEVTLNLCKQNNNINNQSGYQQEEKKNK